MQKEKQINKKDLAKPINQSSRLEDCEPGATRGEVLRFIKTVATSPKPCQKRAEPPVPTLK